MKIQIELDATLQRATTPWGHNRARVVFTSDDYVVARIPIPTVYTETESEAVKQATVQAMNALGDLIEHASTLSQLGWKFGPQENPDSDSAGWTEEMWEDYSSG